MSAIEIAMAILTIIAIVTGPVASLIISDRGHLKRKAEWRQEELFQTLVQTRSKPTSFAHFGPLEYVGIVFWNEENTKLIEAWQKYMRYLHRHIPSIRDREAYDEAQRVVRMLQADLFVEIGKEMGISVPPAEVLSEMYTPSVWLAQELEESDLRYQESLVLKGRMPIRVMTPQRMDDALADHEERPE